MSYLPHQNTTVSERKSMSEITEMLESAGFESTGQASKHGRKVVFGEWHGAVFHFEIEVDKVREAIVKNLSKTKIRNIRNKTEYGKQEIEKATEQAIRIGWRLLSVHVKEICTSIKYGVISPVQGFAGHLMMTTSDGGQMTLSDQITLGIEDGKVQSPSYSPLLLPPSSGGKRSE